MVTVQLAIPLLFTLSWTTAMSADHILSEDSFTRAKGSVILPGLSVRGRPWRRNDHRVGVGQSSTADQLGLTQQRRSEVARASFRQNLSKSNQQGEDFLNKGGLEKKSRNKNEWDGSRAVRSDADMTLALPKQRGQILVEFVKRDTSLITPYCGPLGDRCRRLAAYECARMCVDGQMKTVCRRQHNGTWGCYVSIQGPRPPPTQRQARRPAHY